MYVKVGYLVMFVEDYDFWFRYFVIFIVVFYLFFFICGCLLVLGFLLGKEFFSFLFWFVVC